jgi:hypothetical protein
VRCEHPQTMLYASTSTSMSHPAEHSQLLLRSSAVSPFSSCLV